MSQGTQKELAGETFVLQLLDPVRGHAIQTWQFGGRAMIRIGRSDDNDIALGDPQVSRHHAEVRCHGDVWELLSLGRHGTFIGDEMVETTALEDGAILQLGPTGPKLRFLLALPRHEEETTMIRNGPAISEMLQLDRGRVEQEAREIVDTPSFRRVQDLAGELRKKKSSSKDPTEF
jgi:pSer/pThr/pTyr-binding forkhead associated (FHA) protein